MNTKGHFSIFSPKINLAFMRYQNVISTKVPEVIGGIVYILMPVVIFRNAQSKLSTVTIISDCVTLKSQTKTRDSSRVRRRTKTTFGKPDEALRDGWKSSLVQAE